MTIAGPKPIFSRENPYWQKPPEVGIYPLWYLTQRDFDYAWTWELRSKLGIGRSWQLSFAIQAMSHNWGVWVIERQRQFWNWLNANKRRLLDAGKARILEAAALRSFV